MSYSIIANCTPEFQEKNNCLLQFKAVRYQVDSIQDALIGLSETALEAIALTQNNCKILASLSLSFL